MIRFSILLFAGLAAQIASADPLYTFDSVNQVFNEHPWSLGFVFTANSAFNVDALGWFDATGAGFQSTHTVGIFDADGNLLTSTTLAAGTGDPLSGGFRYHAIAPITLQAGFTYTLAGTSGGPLDAYTANDFVSGLAINPAFTIPCDAARFTDTSEFVEPDSHYRDYRLYLGPNLEGTAEAPEPGTALLLGLGALALFLARRVRQFQ